MASVEYDGSNNQFSLNVQYGDMFHANMTEFTVAPGVTRIGRSAFYGRTQLTSLGGLKNSSVTVIDGYSIFLTGITSLEDLPPGLRRIAIYAFAYCNALASLRGLSYAVDMHEIAFGHHPNTPPQLLQEARERGFTTLNN